MTEITEPAMTVAIIARDEEKNLPALFASLPKIGPEFGRGLQVVVVDTGSRDDTRNIAATWGAEVYDFTWTDDFSAARNHCLGFARGRWILWLDADDVLPKATRAWLEEIRGLATERAYAFNVRSPGPDGTESACAQIRLFPNHLGLAFRHPVHESLGESIVEHGLAVAATGLDIEHTGYQNPESVERKRIRNRKLLERAMGADPPPPALRLAYGRMLMGDRKYLKAEEAFRRILAEKGGTRDVRRAARIHLGQSLGFQGRPEEALAALTLGKDLGRDHAQFQLEYGKALWLTGDQNNARIAWTNCLNSGPELGTIPTDSEAIRAAARKLLADTKEPTHTAHRKPTPPENSPRASDEPSRRLNLSVCCIFKNEAENLPDFIAGLPLNRIEWVVVDTGSTDVTCDLVRAAGVEPHAFPWIEDFAAARNESLAWAQRDWILWLDGDDRLPVDFWDGIAPLLEGPRRAYRFIVRSPRENSHGERFRQIRLFPNHLGIRFAGRIHEQLGTSLQQLGVLAQPADLEILHLGYDTPAKRKSKLARNRAMLEIERRAHPDDATVNLEYGNCLYQSGEYAAAKAAYLTLMPSAEPSGCGDPPPGESSSDEVLRHYPALLGETCVQQGLTDEAAQWFHLAARWNPQDIQPLYWLGKQALESSNVHGALELFYAATDRPAAVGRVATDSHTVRRNALALVVLCELRIFGADKAPRARAALQELIRGGLKSFPLDYRVPWQFFLSLRAHAEAEAYARAYLTLFPQDQTMWEDFLEFLFEVGRHGDVLEIFSARPELVGQSGVLEAFRARCLEKAGADVDRIYAVYRDAMRRFPEDPTLLVYFSDFVNQNQLYHRCYADLKALAQPSETVREFLRQLEAQGLGSGGVT